MSIRHDLRLGWETWREDRSAARRFGDARWTILCLHDVSDARAFNSLLDSVCARFDLVTLAEGRAQLASPPLRRPLLSLTFDDGDVTVAAHAFPALVERKVPACLFIAPGMIDRGFRDPARRAYPVMPWASVEQWAEAGLEIGAHGVNHIPLNQTTLQRAQWEALESQRLLEARFDRPVRQFACPWGYSTDEFDAWLDASDAFDMVCTTLPRHNYPAHASKRVHRHAPPRPAHLDEDLRHPTLYESIRAVHQRTVLNGLAPVLWGRDTDERLFE